MANLKNITELPVAESADGLNLIVNDNGAAKQIAASAVGAQADFNITDESNPGFIKNKPDVALKSDLVQADWNETDESSMAFIKNKPVEEWDFDFNANATIDSDGNFNDPVFVVNAGTFEIVKNKILNGARPKIKINVCYSNNGKNFVQCSECVASYVQNDFYGENPEMIGMLYFDANYGNYVWLMLLEDNTIMFD